MIPIEKRIQTYNKGEITLKRNDLTAVLDMGILVLKTNNGRPTAYGDDELEKFKARSMEFLDYCKTVNKGKEPDEYFIPDLEAWACYCGVSRETINHYARSRKSEWTEFIRFFKTILATAKKQLMLHGRIPQVIAVFDLCNNHYYCNTSEFRIQSIRNNEEMEYNEILTAESLPRLEDVQEEKTTAAGLPRLEQV